MSAMVYKARRDDSGAVVVDWFVADSLDGLSGKIAEGWVTSEATAREALGVETETPMVFDLATPENVGDGPEAIEDVAPEPSPATEEPASEPKSRKSAKKK